MSTARLSRTHTARAMGRASALIAAACSSLWLLELGLPTEVRPALGLVGELAAADQPYAWLFAAGRRAAGVLALLTAGFGAVAGERGRAYRAGWAGLAGFGLAAVASSALPMDCAVSVDAACAAAETAGALSLTHTAHTVSGGLAGAAALAGTASLAIALRGRGGPPFLVTAALLGLQAVAVIAVLLLLSAGAGQPVEGVGLAQRAHFLGITAWLASLASLPGVWRAPLSARAGARSP